MTSITAVFVSGALLLAGVSAYPALAQQTSNHAGSLKGIKLTDTYQLTGGSPRSIQPRARST
jgi:hypothetical protein